MKLRQAKRNLTFLTSEVIDNCYYATYFHNESEPEILEIIEQAVELYNTLMYDMNHPAEKHNPKLVRKHYATIEQKMMSGVDELFEKISTICKNK
ncbi:MAG: hypothetical protein RR931_05115 [Mucinivorans sp.]